MCGSRTRSELCHHLLHFGGKSIALAHRLWWNGLVILLWNDSYTPEGLSESSQYLYLFCLLSITQNYGENTSGKRMSFSCYETLDNSHSSQAISGVQNKSLTEKGGNSFCPTLSLFIINMTVCNPSQVWATTVDTQLLHKWQNIVSSSIDNNWIFNNH